MSPFGKKSFDSSKCVSLLEVTQKRISILRKKRSIVAKQSRDDVAKLLEKGQDANAAARAEHVFREENIVAAYEILEQHCQVVIKGISAIRSEKGCSLELKEAIASLIYAAPRCGDLQELQKVRDIFISRYGTDYVSAILELRPDCAVNTKIIQNLSSRPPNSDVRLNLLKEIASEHKINWNYQRAVAASFKNGEASENSKVPLNANVASKRGDTIPSIPVDTKLEPAASLAVQPATPAKPNTNKSKPSESVIPNQPLDVSRNSNNKPGHKGQPSSSATHNIVPSMAHDISPEERDFTGATKGSFKGSVKVIDTFMHQDVSKESASFASRNSASSTMHKTEPRKKEFVKMEHVLPAEIQKRHSSVMHQDDKLRAHSSSEASNTSSSSRARYGDYLASSKEVLDVVAPTKVKPSIFPGEELTSERSRALPSKASPVQSSDSNMSVSPGELGGPMQQKASTPAFYEAKLFYPKPEPQSLANVQADGIGESLAAKQFVRAHQNHVKVDSARTNENIRGKNFSQIKLQPKQGVVGPAANDTVDSHVKSISLNQFKDNSVHRQTKSSSKALNREEFNNFEKDDAVGQMKGTHHHGVFDCADIHEGSRGGKKGVEWTSSYMQARKHQEEKLSDHWKYSTIAGPNARHSIPPAELRSMKVDVDQEMAELETAIASAARAADTAIELLRTCSIRSRADKKGVQRERNSQARTSYGEVSSETGGFESSKAVRNTLNQQDSFVREPHSTEGDVDHKDPCQEQDSVSLNSEMPHFDDSSDDSTPEVLPPYRKSRLSLKNDHARADLRKESDLPTKSSANGRNDRRQESLHVFVQRNLQKGTFRDDDCAESTDSFSPKSSSSSHQHSNSEVFSDVVPAYKTKHEDYEEPDNVRAWNAALHARNNAYAAGEKVSSGWHGIKNDGVSNMEFANKNVDKGVLRWQGLSTGDISKKKWTLGNAQPPSQPYKQHQGMAAQNSAEKFQGTSRRSVRSVGPTT